ncbi:MAG TPA: FAD-binding oxidoreductase [Bradyrhizobium sp.]|nr:FAD-binding oxidoreductase [Bradyrhizobium sp.]
MLKRSGPATIGATPQRSAWLRTAVPPARFSPLDRDLRTNVAVIGGGYAGLNAALRLREMGKDVVVLETETIGFGASGRNGGQVIPGLKYDPPELIAMFGAQRGGALIEFAGNAPERTFDFIEKHQLDCDAARSGWFQPATDVRTMARARARALSWADRDVRVQIYDSDQTRQATGSDFYIGGWTDPRGGYLQPLSYARELARIAVRDGASIFERSAATATRQTGDGWTVSVNGHTVTAGQVLVCTNGYTGDLVPGLRRSIIPASSIVCATAPLPDELRRSIMPSGLPISDARRLLIYARFDAQGRFLIGARGSFGLHEPESYFQRLRSSAAKIFPQLEDAKWEDSWGGNFALTLDHLPHIHNPAAGLYAVAGCNGRGVAMLSQIGRLIADLAAGNIAQTESPIPITPIAPIPFHPLRRPGLELATLWYRTSDKLGI